MPREYTDIMINKLQSSYFFNDAVIIFLAWCSGSRSVVINLSANRSSMSDEWYSTYLTLYILNESTDFLTAITALCALQLITLCRLKQREDVMYNYNNKRERMNITQSTWVFAVSGGAVGWGTVLQAGRSRIRFPMVSLQFLNDIIVPTTLWPWGWVSL